VSEPSQQDHALSYRDRAVGLTIGSALLWLAAAAVIVADASLRDRIPDSVSSGLCVLAGTATIGALVWWTRTVSSEAIGRLAAEVEQVSAKLGTPTVEAANPDDMRRISRESFALGRKVERNHADGS
jgi:hypothetical protein